MLNVLRFVMPFQVLSWNGSFKLLNPSKYVRSMALVHGKLFCGCNDSSIQVSAAEIFRNNILCTTGMDGTD